jgi:hypothetical protein
MVATAHCLVIATVLAARDINLGVDTAPPS